MASAGVCAVLTDERHLDKARALLAEYAPEVVCTTPDLLAREAGTAAEADGATEADVAAKGKLPSPGPEDLAFLQYTSGSTSEPRGVMVSHANLLDNLRLIQRSFGLRPDTRIGGWLPPYHDMGLMGTLLLPLFLGTESFVMSPSTFLRRPVLWLEMIGTHGIELSPAPNFAYDMCVRRITDEQVARLDLSRWRWAVNGAEPVHASTVRDFTRHFAPSGLRPEALCPSYGMAEVALFVCGGPSATAPVLCEVDGAALAQHRLRPARGAHESRVLVGSGPLPDGGSGPLPTGEGAGADGADGFDLRIVDPASRRELADGEVGEIWLRGASVARGYWGLEEETGRVFHARTADGTGPFLRTGDLGVRHGGQLYVTGRIKEVLILNGRNIYPQDIERAARARHPVCAEGFGAAFTVPVGDRDERMVLVQEIRARDLDEPGLREVAHGLMADLSAEFGLAMANIVLVPPGAVLRSTSGKVKRVAMRELFTRGSLAPVFEEVDAVVRERFRPAGDAPVTVPAGRPTTRESLT